VGARELAFQFQEDEVLDDALFGDALIIHDSESRIEV
jgi:hypothetical protein